jgi:hypothetical protein
MGGLRFPRRLTVLLLLATILASPVLGAEPRPRAEGRRADSVPSMVLKIRVELSSILNRLWIKAGCIIDPNGVCTTEPSLPTVTADETEIGCGIDPHGSCDPG